MKNKKTLTKRIAAATLGACIAIGSSLTTFAAEPARTVPNSPDAVDIPVTASIDSYYIIGVPAAAGLTLSQDHNDKLVTKDSHGAKVDTNSTFYGQCNVQAKGSLGSGKTLKATLTIADLADSSTHTAVVGLNALAQAANTNMDKIWASDSSATIHNFVDTDWTAGSTGINVTYADTVLRSTDWYTNCVMLRTTLPTDGTYTSNLAIAFSVE